MCEIERPSPISFPELSDQDMWEKNANPNDSNCTAWLRRNVHNLSGFADDYACAVRCLADDVQKEPDSRDFTIIPILYLIRHSLELRIKNLLQLLNHRQIKTHDLKCLWNEFGQAYNGDKSNPSYKNADRLILMFGKLDNNGEIYRYPMTHDCISTYHIVTIDIENLCSVFSRLNSFLSCLEDELENKE